MKKYSYFIFFTFIFQITFSTKESTEYMGKSVDKYKDSFSYKYLEINTKKKVFYSSILSLLLAKSSLLLSNKIKKLKLLTSKQKIIGSFLFGYSASSVFDYFMQHLSFYNLRTEMSNGKILSSHSLEEILPTDIHKTAKFFNNLNEDDLKNFLLYFNIDKFIEITKSKHFSAIKTVKLMNFFEEKNNEEYLKLFEENNLKYLMNPECYPLQRAVSFINKAFIEKKNCEIFKSNLKNAFINLLENYNLSITFMSFGDEVRHFIISSLTKEEKDIFYEKILFKYSTASNFREQITKIFETDDYKELLLFTTWYFNKFKEEYIQNEFCIQLLKIDLIKNYADFVNSLKDKELEENKNNFIKVMLRTLNNEKLFYIKIYYKQLFNEKWTKNDKDEILKDIKHKLEYKD